MKIEKQKTNRNNKHNVSCWKGTSPNIWFQTIKYFLQPYTCIDTRLGCFNGEFTFMLLLFSEQHWCNKGHFTKSIKVTLKMFRVWAEERETMLMVLRLLIWHIHFPIGRFSYSNACTLLTKYKVGRHSANVANNRTILALDIKLFIIYVYNSM